MKKIVFITAIALLIILGIIYYQSNRPKPTEYSRTYYQGYVMIEPNSLSVIAAALEKNGCSDSTAEDSVKGVCFFSFLEGASQQKSLIVYPLGIGMGPISFILKEDQLIFDQDIFGKPDKEKCKVEVRNDLKSVGNIVKIKEDTWNFKKIEYPWDVIY